MSNGSSSMIEPSMSPSLNGLSHNEDSINITSANPMTTPIPMGNAPAKPTLQTNSLGPLDGQAYYLKTSVDSANPMSTHIPMGNNPVHSQPGSLGGPIPMGNAPAKPTFQTNSKHIRISASKTYRPIIRIRNPDPLDGQENLTRQTDPLQPPSYRHRPVPIVAIGNPGSGKSTILNAVIFFITQIGRNYGVIVNKIPGNVQSQLSEGVKLLRLVLSLYAGIEDGFNNKIFKLQSFLPIRNSYQHHLAPIVAIGNPGSGKSTILNALAGQLLFGSGISIGCSLTSQFESKEANGRTFIDTPGVADDTYQQAAGEALTKVFRQGGPMKILFFITQESGRIESQDVTTMKLVLESVPEIGRNYGIIVNKIPEDVLSQLSDEGNLLRLILSLYAGIEDGFKNQHKLFLPLKNKLNNKKNAILCPSQIHPNLENFINTTVPEAYITPGRITKNLCVNHP